MKKVIIILNPAAGKKKSKGTLFDIVSRFCAEGWTVSAQTTLYAGHAVEIAANACGNYDLIVCVGGDGTLNEVITGIMKKNGDIEVGYVPCGSTNDFARSLGIPTVVPRTVEGIITSEAAALDVGRFNDRYFSYIASFGAFTSTSYNTPQSMKNTLGHMAYILAAVGDISKIHRCHMKLSHDGEEYEDDFIFASVSNSTSVAGVVKLDRDIVDLTDGLFEVILARYPANPPEVSRIIHGLTSSNFSDPLFRFFKTAKISFDTEEDVPWSLDGEYQESVPHIEIENVHSALKLRNLYNFRRIRRNEE
jgi:YegS/Rv2252/BmrU family lipid kinase